MKALRIHPLPEPQREVVGKVVFAPSRGFSDVDAELARLEAEKVKLERLIELRQAVARLRVEAALMGSHIDRFQVILEVVAARTGCQSHRIVGRDKHEDATWPRHLVCQLARQHTTLTLSQIGKALDGRDHGTVLNSLDVLRDRRTTEKEFDALARELDVECRARLGEKRK